MEQSATEIHMWSVDLAVSARTYFLSHNVPEASKNVFADIVDHLGGDGWIPPASINNYALPLFEYPLWWVVGSSDYMLYTGDLAYAKSYYKNLIAVMDKWYPSVTGSHGLLSKGLNNTSGYGADFFSLRRDEVTYYNGLYVLGLKAASGIAKALGSTADAAAWTNRAVTVVMDMHARPWDSSVGVYYDTSDQSTGVRHSKDGNALAVLVGVASKQRAQSALDHLSKATRLQYGNAFFDTELHGVYKATQRVYAFISYFELQTHFESDTGESPIEQMMRSMYGWMAKQDTGVTMWEGPGPPDASSPGDSGTQYYEGAYTSLAHGWSTGVLPVLSN